MRTLQAQLEREWRRLSRPQRQHRRRRARQPLRAMRDDRQVGDHATPPDARDLDARFLGLRPAEPLMILAPFGLVETLHERQVARRAGTAPNLETIAERRLGT